jgi:hypothetical protein
MDPPLTKCPNAVGRGRDRATTVPATRSFINFCRQLTSPDRRMAVLMPRQGSGRNRFGRC